MSKKCEKCGKSTRFNTTHYDSETDTLTQRCDRCGYEWRIDPKDKSSSKGEDIWTDIFVIVILGFALYGLRTALIMLFG